MKILKDMEKHSEDNSVPQDLKEMGRFYLLSKQYDEAIKSLTSASEISPDDPEVYYLLGMVYESIHQFDKAKLHYEKAAGINPDFKDVQKRLSRIIGE